MLRIRGTRWRGRFLLALGSMAITLLLAEVGARVHHATHGGSAVRLDDAAAVSAARERRENHALRLGDIVRPAPWDDVVYELIPGMQGDFIGVPYRTNSHGMRDRELPLRKPADEYRIALIGDSFAFGWGVADGKTFADVAAERGITLPAADTAKASRSLDLGLSLPEDDLPPLSVREES